MEDLLKKACTKRSEMYDASEKLKKLYSLRNNYDKGFFLNIVAGGNGYASDFIGMNKEITNTIKILVKAELDKNIELLENRIKGLIGDYKEESSNE